MAGVSSRKRKSKPKKRKPRKSRLWSVENIRKEQLRATIAIAAVAACYYSKSLISSQVWIGQLFLLSGILLVVLWGMYLILISASTASDLRIAPLRVLLDENSCDFLARCAHLFYGGGVLLVLFIISIFGLDQLPSALDLIYKLVSGNQILVLGLGTATCLFVAIWILPRLDDLDRWLTKPGP